MALFALVVVSTSLWMFFDAASFRYRKQDIKGLASMGPWGWLFCGFFLWIVAFPLYLSQRAKLRAAGQQAAQDGTPGPALSHVQTVGAVAVASLLAAVSLAGRRPEQQMVGTARAAQPPAQPPAPAPAVEPERAPEPEPLTFSEALTKTLPMMGDSTTGPSMGAALLAVWLDQKGVLSDVRPARDETTLALIKKDVHSERGKRMCVRGTIIQISRAARDSGVFEGNMMTPGFQVVNFLSARSTGDLVEQSRARFCGVVAGLYAFPNVSGGETQSVQMVGMFDLPDNSLLPSRTWVERR